MRTSDFHGDQRNIWLSIRSVRDELDDIKDRLVNIAHVHGEENPERLYVWDWANQLWIERKADKGTYEALSKDERDLMRKHNKKQWLNICYNEFLNYLPEDI